MRIWYRFRVCMAIADYPWFLIPSQVSGRAWFCASNLTRAFLRKQFDACLFAQAIWCVPFCASKAQTFFILSSFSANLVVDPEKHCNERKRCLVPVNKIWNIECNGMPSWQNFFVLSNFNLPSCAGWNVCMKQRQAKRKLERWRMQKFTTCDQQMLKMTGTRRKKRSQSECFS